MCTDYTLYIWVERWAKTLKAAINYILTDLFILSKHISLLSKSFTQRSLGDRSNLSWPDKRKEKPGCDFEKRHTFKDARRDSEDTTTTVWFAETHLTVNSPIRSPKMSQMYHF